MTEADVIYFAQAPSTATFFDHLKMPDFDANESLRFAAQARVLFGPGQYAEAHSLGRGNNFNLPQEFNDLLLQAPSLRPHRVGRAHRDPT